MKSIIYDSLDIEDYISTSDFHLEKLLSSCDICDDLTKNKSVRVTPLTLKSMDTFNDIQMEIGNPLVITESIVNGDLDFDVVKMEEAKEGIIKKTFKTIKRIIETIFNKTIDFFKRLFSYSYRTAEDLKKIKERLNNIGELDVNKLKTTLASGIVLERKLIDETDETFDKAKQQYQEWKKKAMSINTTSDYKNLFSEIAENLNDAYLLASASKKTIKKKKPLYDIGIKSKADLKTRIDDVEELMKFFDKNKNLIEYLKGELKEAKKTIVDLENTNGKISWAITRLRIGGIKISANCIIKIFSIVGKINMLSVSTTLSLAKKALKCEVKSTKE